MPPDWQDLVVIVLLLLTIAFYEERNAGNAVRTLMDSLSPKRCVCREIESMELLPGDKVVFRIGVIAPWIVV